MTYRVACTRLKKEKERNRQFQLSEGYDFSWPGAGRFWERKMEKSIVEKEPSESNKRKGGGGGKNPVK